MNRTTQKKNEKLGMSCTVARSRLLKMILFKLLMDHNLNVCYRCNQKINNIEDLSIEHKVAWLNSENPKELFFDLGNIAFSHLKCNCISRDYSEEGLKILSKNFSGINNPTNKLSEQDVKEIKKELSLGASLRVLAERFKVNHTTIGDINQNKTWKNIILDLMAE